MSMHLFLMGDVSDGELAEIVAAVKPDHTSKVVRCKTSEDVLRVVVNVALTEGVIDRLDLYDHAGPGGFWLGEELLFSHDGTGLALARMLRPFLTPDARVRLLGCKTALGEEGRRLLLSLRQELGGGVAVYGTLDRVTSEHLGPGGFKVEWTEQLLFSSTEAAARVAPDTTQRMREIMARLGAAAALGLPR